MILIGLFFDILTKSLAYNSNSILIDGFLSLFFTWNTGAGWSLFADQTLFLAIFSGVLVVGIIVFIALYKPKSKTYAIGIGLVLAGAIGNFIDRIFFGAVRDFIKLDFINFPIFNIADSCLTVGAILICVWLVFIYSKPPKKEIKND